MFRALTNIALVVGLTFSSTGFAFRTLSPGGSNYAWYNLDAPFQPAPQTGQNCREPYGIIANYHQPGVRSTVQSQLSQMRANGQERLRIPIYHGRGLNTGTVMDSTGGNLSATHRQNLQNFLADIKTAGFAEIMVGFFPTSAFNDPIQWSAWREDGFQENWNLIFTLRPLIVNAGILYRIDLMNEGAPTSGQTRLQEYVRRLWGNYNYVFGKADTVGVSIIGDNIDRYVTMRNVMLSTGYGLPYLYSVHFYESAVSGNAMANLHQAMQSRGDAGGWIIGEVLYQDQTTLNKMLTTYVGTRPIFFVLQWPVSRGRGCDGHADVAPPVDFSVYRQLHL
jgi:hypothetical protein